MKKLFLIMLMITMSACQLSREPKSFILHTFPLEFQGYYTKISGDTIYDELQDEFKISENYMTYKDKIGFQDNSFITYIIESIRQKDRDIFCFNIENAYKDSYDPIGTYQFEKIAGELDQVKVTYTTLVVPTLYTAIYEKNHL